MHIFTFLNKQNKRMKNLLLIFAILFASVSFGQTTFPSIYPFNTNYEVYSQMWNVKNVYFNTPTSANLGKQLDTTTGGTALVLYTAALSKGIVNIDTFKPSPLKGYVSLTLVASVLKVTADTVYVTALCSLDGINYHPLQGQPIDTLYPTSLTVSVGCEHVISINSGGKNDRYYAMSFMSKTGKTSSVQAWYYLQLPVMISK